MMQKENEGLKDLEIELTKAQELFINSTTRGTILIGGIGSGKTRSICSKALNNAFFRHRRSAIISFSYRNLEDVILETIYELINSWKVSSRLYEINKSDMIVRFGGTKILLRSGDKPDRLRGLNLHDFYIDEGREFPDGKVFRIMLGRIRKVWDAQWYIGTSSRGRNWVYDLIAKNNLENVFKSGYEKNYRLTAIWQSTLDNIFLPQSYIDDLLDSYDGEYAQQEIYGQIVDLAGGLFERKWFETIIGKWIPTKGVRYWDLAASIKTAADYSAGVLMARNGVYCDVCDVIRTKSLYPVLKELIISTAEMDGPGVVIYIEVVGMQKVVYDDLLVEPRLAKYTIKPDTPRDDKYARLLPLAPRFKAGTIRLCRGAWNGAFIDEACGISPEMKGKDDQVDSAAGAFKMLNVTPTLANPKEGVYPFTGEQKQDLLTVSAIELKDYTAYIVRAVWQPYIGVLQIVDELETTSIDGIKNSMVKSKYRLGPEELDSENIKSLYAMLVKAKSPVVMTELGLLGSVYSYNAMVDKIHIPKQTKTYSEVLSWNKDEGLPDAYIRCLLRMVQEIKVWKKSVPYETQSFETKRGRYYTPGSPRKTKQEKEWV